MRPVNLIPPEDRRGEAAPLRAGAASYVVVAVLAVALLAVIAVVLSGNSINEKKSQLATLQAKQQQSQARADQLAPYTQFASDAQLRIDAVTSLANSRFDWRRVLKEMSLVIPDDIWLESLTGTVSPGVSLGDGGSAGTTIDPSIVGPSLHIVGCGSSQDAVAGFLAAIKDIDGVTRVGITSSKLGDETDSSDAAATAGTDAGGGESTDCQTQPSVAKFDVTLAFDAVPASEFTPTPDGAPAVAATTETTTTSTDGTAGTTPTTPTATTPTTPTTTSTDGVSDGVAEEQSANSSANKQIDKAKNGAKTVGVGG